MATGRGPITSRFNVRSMLKTLSAGAAVAAATAAGAGRRLIAAAGVHAALRRRLRRELPPPGRRPRVPRQPRGREGS